MSKKKRIGFFGGSFDPIHLGHLHLALQMLEIHQLDQVYFCPASQSPHKKETPPQADKEHRRAMVVAAIAPIPVFTFLDLEIQRNSHSYTIDTIRDLLARDEKEKIKKEYHLILGEDALQNFHLWKEFEELIHLAPPLIGSRAKAKDFLPKNLPAPVAAALKKGLTPIPLIEISSTDVRSRLGQGLYCGHLLPAKVWEYIVQNKLYNWRDKT